MRILLVNAYEENKKGILEFNIFQKIFLGLLRQTSTTVDNGIQDVTVRRINCLSDIVLDWEHEIIPPNAAELAKEFDKYDMVCISGDMKFLPWEPFFFQTITLIHMCHVTNKPIVTCGGGAFAAVYAAATQGTKFYILNGANGGSIENMKQFPVHCPGTKANPCGYLDNETGDIYTYETATRSWTGRCNTGIYRNCSSGKPSSARFRAPKKKFTGLKRDRNLPGTANDRDTIVVIRNQALQHFALRTCQSPNFVARAVGDWFLNVEGGMPLQAGLKILAESPYGPALIGMDRAFHIALMVDESYSSETTRDILLQYLKHTITSISTQGSGRNLYDFLFDTNKGITDKHKLATHMAESLCHIPTRSRVSGGPERVEVPLPSSFEVRIRTSEEVTAQLTAVLHSTRLNVKKEPDSCVCNPRGQNKTRLLKVIGKYTNKAGTNKMAQFMSGDNTLDTGTSVELQHETSISSHAKFNSVLYHNFMHEDSTPAAPRTPAPPILKDPSDPPEVDLSRPHTTMSEPSQHRLNWENNWLNVRPHSPFEKRQEVDEAGRKKETYTPMTRRTSQHYLPVQHPREGASAEAKKVIHRTAPCAKPFNSWAKFEDMDDVTVEDYQGTYRGGFLTPYERERKEYTDAKTKFIAGGFRNYSGVASQIPLRKEGGVRVFGEYPADITSAKDKVRNKPFLPAKNLYKMRRSVTAPRIPKSPEQLQADNSGLCIY